MIPPNVNDSDYFAKNYLKYWGGYTDLMLSTPEGVVAINQVKTMYDQAIRVITK
jgi:hypothetical protein